MSQEHPTIAGCRWLKYNKQPERGHETSREPPAPTPLQAKARLQQKTETNLASASNHPHCLTLLENLAVFRYRMTGSDSARELTF
jgi:hypothetical protein